MTGILKHKLFYLAAVFICLPGIVFSAVVPAEPPAADDNYYFTRYTSANSGLSYDAVTEIIQDRKGFMWFGTMSGVSRFDGARFKTYTREDLGLRSAYVTSLCLDDYGNLWVGTDVGITVYNAKMDCFEPFVIRSDIGTVIANKTNVICKGPGGVIWISVNSQGLFSYDPAAGELKNFFFEDGKQTLPVNIRTLYVDSAGGIWLSLHYNALFYLDGGKIAELSRGDWGNEFLSGDDVVAVQAKPGDRSVVYAASVARGLCRLDMKDRSVTVLVPASAGFFPEDLYVGSDGRVWMATTEGVYIYDPDGGAVRRLVEDRRNRFSLSDSHAFSIYIDSADGLWIGTNVGGVNYSGAFQRNFEKYDSTDGTALGDCLVRGFADDGSGRIWITTEKQGLLVYDARDRSLRKYPHDHLPNTMFAACYDGGMLWLGTLKGLYRLDTRTGGIKVYETLEQSSRMSDSRVYAITKTAAGSILVGTTVGLLRYNTATDAFDPIKGFEGVFVTGMDEDGGGLLWVSTYADGLISYDTGRGAVTGRYANDPHSANSVPSNKLFSVCVGSGEDIWMTSFGGGFCRFDKTAGYFQTYDMAHYGQLSTDIYFKIIEDGNGMMWVTSDKGLLSFDPATEEIRKFSLYDGLLNDEFKNCGIKTADGDIYFGSKNGFIRFNPDRFVADNGSPRLVITDLRIGDEVVTPSTPGSPLTECNVDETENIHLPPRQNSFGFNFAILGSVSPGMNAILCRLEGYDDNWQYVSADNSIFYYNVPAGTYTLKVKGERDSGVSSVSHAALTVVIAQKFYKSTAAVVIYVLAFILCVSVVFVIIYRRAIAKEKRRLEEYKQRKEVELFKEKLSFFSNIVHEIKAPLTLIRTPLQNIIVSGNLDESDMEDAAVISNSVEYLDRLIKELLDFVRVEKHAYVLERTPMDIIEQIDFMCFNFSETARNRNLRLSFSHEAGPVRIDADRTALSKILNNLMDNAVKYAESYINIHAEVKDGAVAVSISNDGPLISPEQRAEIFKPFVQYNNDKQSYSPSFGIGLALARTLTEMHGGSLVLDEETSCTTFALTLPVITEQERDEAAEIAETTAENPARPLLLLVEDNRELASYLKRKLGPDYRVLVSHSAENALPLLRQYEMDIIVTDIALSGMTGIELCRTIAGDFELSHIPVVVISAISATNTKIACMEAGASMYIEKPFSLDYLQACVKGILDKRASLRSAYRDLLVLPDPRQFNLPGADEEFLKKLDRVIMENIKDPAFSSSQIEEALFISRSTLIRKVRALLDTTPHDHLRFRRLSVAAELLAQNKCRVSEVCYAVGFNSPSYFAKCFRQQFGILPAEYQKKR